MKLYATDLYNAGSVYEYMFDLKNNIPCCREAAVTGDIGIDSQEEFEHLRLYGLKDMNAEVKDGIYIVWCRDRTESPAPRDYMYCSISDGRIVQILFDDEQMDTVEQMMKIDFMNQLRIYEEVSEMIDEGLLDNNEEVMFALELNDSDALMKHAEIYEDIKKARTEAIRDRITSESLITELEESGIEDEIELE